MTRQAEASRRYREAERLERERAAQRAYHARLAFCHGPERAASIVAGTDTDFNADVAAWRALCARCNPPGNVEDGRVRGAFDALDPHP